MLSQKTVATLDMIKTCWLDEKSLLAFCCNSPLCHQQLCLHEVSLQYARTYVAKSCFESSTYKHETYLTSACPCLICCWDALDPIHKSPETGLSEALQVYAARLISCIASTTSLKQSLAEAGVLHALTELLSFTHASLLHEGMHSIGRLIPGCRLAQQQAQHNHALVPLLRLYAGTLYYFIHLEAWHQCGRIFLYALHLTGKISYSAHTVPYARTGRAAQTASCWFLRSLDTFCVKVYRNFFGNVDTPHSALDCCSCWLSSVNVDRADWLMMRLCFVCRSQQDAAR